MEERPRYERALKRQKRDIRGSLNKVALSSDVIVKRLEDGSIEGIKLQYELQYSRTEITIAIDTLQEFIGM